VSFGHDVTVSKVSSKARKADENSLEETVAVPMKQRHQANVIRPTYPVWIVDYGNKVEKNSTEDWLRPVVRTDGGDDHIHVDAKTGEVHHGLHSTNASNRGLPFGLVRIGKIHYVFRSSFYLTQELLFDKDFIPLWKKSGRFH
jgi:hypothetical protein